MSVARAAPKRLLSRRLLAAQAPSATAPLAATSRKEPPTCHNFHSGASLEARARPRFKNVKASDMDLVRAKDEAQFTKEKFPDYTEEELKLLGKRYSSKQMEALKTAEAVIDPNDLSKQGRLRTDPYRLRYIEDFKTIQPTIDLRKKTGRPPNPKSRFMDEDEFMEDLGKWAKEQLPGGSEPKTVVNFVPAEYRGMSVEEWPRDVLRDAQDDLGNYEAARTLEVEEAIREADPDSVNILKYFFKRPSMTHMEHGDEGMTSSSAPALPNKVPGVAGLYEGAADPEDQGKDDIGTYQELKRTTGLTLQEIQGMTNKVLVRRFVSNQTRLGKVQSAWIMAMAGNKNGWLGLGVAKSTDAETATIKAQLAAVQNMRPIRRYEDRTIYGTIEKKIAGTVVRLSARPPGFGLRVPARIFEMCRACGIQDLAAKFPRSRSPMNTVKAAYQALVEQPDPEEIAIGRGKKLVDARKVYYGGAVF